MMEKTEYRGRPTECVASTPQEVREWLKREDNADRIVWIFLDDKPDKDGEIDASRCKIEAVGDGRVGIHEHFPACEAGPDLDSYRELDIDEIKWIYLDAMSDG